MNPISYGICNISVLPLRKSASHTSEMVSQLLFGETYMIMESTENGWLRIICTHDEYEGWVVENQVTEISHLEYNKANKDFAIVLEMSYYLRKNEGRQFILMGSLLPQFNNGVFYIDGERRTYYGNYLFYQGEGFRQNDYFFKMVAIGYLNAPYLWGGRSPFGIDCSGFIQMVFRIGGINIARDAYQQANYGDIVSSIKKAKPIDLMFFANEEGKVTHVGLYLGDERIIHASGCVKIDYVDERGICDAEMGLYTHKLHSIRRIPKNIKIAYLGTGNDFNEDDDSEVEP